MQHIVQSNDNPTKLAIKYVGDSKRWPELCAANPQLAKHAEWGCVFPAVGKAINLPDSWTVAADPNKPGGSTLPVATEPGKVDTKVILIGAAVVAAVVVFVYARGKKKMVANRRRRARRRRNRS